MGDFIVSPKETNARRWAATALGLTVAAAFGAPPAVAQDVELSDVIVEGRRATESDSDKFTAPLIDMPQTVTVIPSDVFNDQGARNLTDVLRNTPGITFNAGENGFASGVSNFSMRGFDSSANIFIDGARDSGSYSRDAFNVDRVEVVKGPSGDNGRGGAGGYVNIVTKTPHSEAAYSAAVSYGFDDYASDNRTRATIDLNQPVSPTAAVRLNVLWEDGGWPTRDVASRSSFGFAPSLALGLGTPTRFTFALQYVQQDDIPDWGVPTVFIDGMRDNLLLPGGINTDDYRDVFYGLSSDFDEIESSVVLARFERTLTPDVEFLAQLRWSLTDRFAAYTLPTQYNSGPQTISTQRQAYARENDSLSLLAGLRASATTGGFEHNIAAGLEYTREEASARAFATINNPGGAVPIAVRPDPDRAGAFTGTPTETSDVRVNTLALYLYDTIELSSRWQLTGGFRLERYDVEIDSATVGGAPTGADGLNVSEDTFSGRLGLVYKPVDNASIYGSIGVSALPPASFLSNTDISRGGDNAFPGFDVGVNSDDTDVQEAVNYELGFKWDLFDQNLSLTAALFRTERHNVAITGRPDLIATDSELLGYGEQIVEGLEVSLAGRITPEWSVFAGALFMDSERRHGAELDLGRCRAQPSDFGAASAAACDADIHRARGDALAFTPEVSATLWTTYEFPFGLTVGGGVRYVGESFVGRPDDAERIIPNDPSNMLPEYWVADMLIEYQLTPEASIRLNVDNVTDEFYAVSTNWAARRATLGPGRSFVLSLNLRM